MLWHLLPSCQEELQSLEVGKDTDPELPSLYLKRENVIPHWCTCLGQGKTQAARESLDIVTQMLCPVKDIGTAAPCF